MAFSSKTNRRTTPKHKDCINYPDPNAPQCLCPTWLSVVDANGNVCLLGKARPQEEVETPVDLEERCSGWC